MLPQVNARHWLTNYDAFRSVPKDLAEAHAGGAVLTVVAVITCVILFVCETTAFLTAKPRTQIVIDSNEDPNLKINFDVTMYDMLCDHVTVGVWDAFGTERMNITRNVQKQRIDHKGTRKGLPYTEDELVELEYSEKSFTKEELSELDSDWSSTSDHFKHDSFESVIEAHDYTFVNFYADWCPHCRNFVPTWGEFEQSINSGNVEVKDADGNKANLRVLKINCVDFEETCQHQRVQGFPTIRMYRRGVQDKGNFVEYSGPRRTEGLKQFVNAEVGKHHLHTGKVSYHSMFAEGCRISGSIEAARVPGTVHFQAQHTKERTLNLAFTNVSHLVHHFSFGEAPRRTIWALPSEYKKSVNPLDGRGFTVDKFHKAPNHFIKVVHTRFEGTGIRSYQQTHQWSTRTLQRNAVPQAKFSYDLAPVEVVVTQGERRWYDFMTSIFGIVGGAYTIMGMSAGMVKTVHVHVKEMMGKNS